MLKSKGAVIGVAVALVGAALLAAGMAVSTTSGAGTDAFNGAPTSGFPDVTGPAPAAPTDPSIPGTDPGNPAGIPASPTTPDGSAGAGGTAPDALPNAGFGMAESGNSFGVLVALLAVAGAALIGAGATAVSAGRRD